MKKKKFLKKIAKSKKEWHKEIKKDALDYAYGGDTDAYVMGIVSTNKVGAETEFTICSCDEFFEMSQREFYSLLKECMFENIEFGLAYKNTNKWI